MLGAAGPRLLALAVVSMIGCGRVSFDRREGMASFDAASNADARADAAWLEAGSDAAADASGIDAMVPTDAGCGTFEWCNDVDDDCDDRVDEGRSCLEVEQRVPRNGVEYLVLRGGLTADVAVRRCLGVGGVLPAVRSDDDDATLVWLTDSLGLQQIWLGGRDRGGRVFAWNDGAGDVFWIGNHPSAGGAAPAGAYVNWASDQPETSEACVRLNRLAQWGGLAWHDADCTSWLARAVCEVRR